MPENEIYLSKSDIRILKKLERNTQIKWASIEAAVYQTNLDYCDLVVPSKTGEYARITTAGRQALFQYRKEKRNQRSEHTHNWLISIFSVVGGALLSDPLWAGIRCLVSWLSENS